MKILIVLTIYIKIIISIRNIPSIFLYENIDSMMGVTISIRIYTTII